MTKREISEIKDLLKSPKKIVIVPHKNPDGDAMGSTLGLYHYLKLFNHDATIIAPNDYPDFLKWLPGDEFVLKYDTDKTKADELILNAELVFTLDFNALHRTGDMETVLFEAKGVKILIDHHQQPDNYAKYIYSDVTMCSTAQMIYHFIEMLGDVKTINSDISTCLYTGIMTDTGSFRFRSTTSTTHRVIANLIDNGADNAQIHNNVYDTNSYNKLQLLGCALSNLKLISDSNTAYITLSQKELNTFDYKKGDTEGVVNYALSLSGVKFAVIFIENKSEGIIKISLRSKGNFDVNTFAREHFNGGGHINASGGRSELSLKKTVEKFISILPTYKNDLKS
ncbi:bifunctional oligoribonuclease/PAP phosphatase NrnA [Flavobacteriaceae bacterium S0825]|uniref:DHH family phosphoesterase n=1 Tax=Gaetbulibacter sp. S0825 TaxID=2720084 RepID=UPI001430008A|nr:bifunctional oligoribonuclease/PAP phosphatase NrnA [Gaetbulibacter sp. S0825]MCK0110104.1 bifunctional oligoribonuclease/PAP phosphatase NrnA [Flavobacteriaceae bacterium S0825]NIX65733.1 bifunctional oligoribonuclease/PAP phosphatase NrnA [Gaetbulibacter sp. S0825]